MDIASLLGVIIGLAMVIFGIVTGDGGFSLETLKIYHL